VNNPQKGFAHVVGLVLVLLVAVVGGTGYFVWQSVQKADKNSAAASQSKNNSTTNKTPQPTQNVSSQKYFKIKEWGVEAPYSGALNLQYRPGSDGSYIIFSSKELIATDPACKTAAIINRAKPTKDMGFGMTAAEEAAYLDNKGFKDHSFVGGYYYFASHGQAACSEDSKANNLEYQIYKNVAELTVNLQVY
jgi:hypothetical protein